MCDSYSIDYISPNCHRNKVPGCDFFVKLHCIRNHLAVEIDTKIEIVYIEAPGYFTTPCNNRIYKAFCEFCAKWKWQQNGKKNDTFVVFYQLFQVSLSFP